MENVLMIISHPQWNVSFGNKIIAETFAEISPSAQISNLFVEYPDGNINVEIEQKKLLDADTIILQFPIEWYGAPSILHKWFEDVLTYGFAFGNGGDKLQDKRLIASFTSGTPADTYVEGGLQSYPMDYFMYPLIALVNRCGMKWDGYVYTGGVMAAFADADQLKKIETDCKYHAKRLAEKIEKK